MRIRINTAIQTLELRSDTGLLVKNYSISSAAKGVGQLNGSNQTPLGKHIIRAKIGTDQPINTVFRARRPTGEIWTPELATQFPSRDWVLTRIMWLSGCTVGHNRLGNVDTMRRYIYLHGSPDPVPMGVPGSIGCIRMRNADIVELFDLTPPYTSVNITNFRIVTGSWTDLLPALRSVRETVFITEQGITEIDEWDDDDPDAIHAVAFSNDGSAIGTARLLTNGSLGRLAVLHAWRRKGVGLALMEKLLDQTSQLKDGKLLKLHAQLPAVNLYRKLGFETSGEVFDEVGIPHRLMTKQVI